MELKTWVAKEATDNGQVVDDSMLTDQAIFDRLDHDVEYGETARMVQRYGYLLPECQSGFGDGEAPAELGSERARPYHGATTGPEQAARWRMPRVSAGATESRSRSCRRIACDPRNQAVAMLPVWREEATEDRFRMTSRYRT